MIRKKDMGFSHGLMGDAMKDIEKMISNMELECYIKTESQEKANGMMES